MEHRGCKPDPAALAPPEDQARWKAYQEMLVTVTAEGGRNKAVGLDMLLASLLQSAQQRSLAGNAVMEHRAMLVVLAFYVNGKGLAALVPAARGSGLCRPVGS